MSDRKDENSGIASGVTTTYKASILELRRQVKRTTVLLCYDTAGAAAIAALLRLPQGRQKSQSRIPHLSAGVCKL
ncbi:MAG: hypothetical protein ACJ8LG_01205 [Massilia sp.]